MQDINPSTAGPTEDGEVHDTDAEVTDYSDWTNDDYDWDYALAVQEDQAEEDARSRSQSE